jgi:hypothetical protein
VNPKIRLAALAAIVFLAGGCSQKDPAAEAIDAAEGALEAVYEDAQKYEPERYAEVKTELETARKAFDEERYADAIAAVKDVPAHAEELAKASAEAKQKRLAELNTEWTQLSDRLPGIVAGIETRLGELGKMRKLPEGMDKQLLNEANAAFGSAMGAWDEASAAFAAGDLDSAVTKARDVESMAQDLMARLGMQAG